MTFLMTDVEGSTRLWEQQREEMATALAAHDRILKVAIEHHGGELIKTTGDGVLARFSSATDALMAAAGIQRHLAAEEWPTHEPIRVRVAVHTGLAQARQGDFFGPALNRTARLLAIGHGGQVLASSATAELTRDDLGNGLTLIDQGEHRLRDLDRPERVFQLVGSGLTASFPPLRSEARRRTNLPAQLTTFVGRRQELADLRELVRSHRLVTLVGVGGTGKTRLMLELAAELVDRFDDGVWLVELAGVTDAQLVVGQIARSLGLENEPGRPTIDTLTDFLRDKTALVLLDNCEHLIAASATAAQQLSAACPGLTLIATSREALGIAGEVAFHVPSLGLPDEPRFGEIGASEAVQLFVERATAVLPTFSLSQANAEAVAAICRRLDGIPLAIELAASRVTVLSVDEIRERLGDRFRLLTGGSRSALPRQQTLQALIDWSWNLLPADDQRLLARLSVFAGGWTLDAAANVVPATDGRLVDSLAALDGLSRLVDRSLVQVDHGEATRYRLLETIRQYARDRLVEADEADATRAAHFSFFFDLALAAEGPLAGADMIEWLHRLDAEVDNLRAALDWGMEADADRAIRMNLALAAYWRVRSFGTEPVDRLTGAAEAALARPPQLTGPGRSTTIVTARVVAAASMAHAAWGSPPTAMRYADRALSLARDLNDPEAILESLGAAGTAAVFAGAPTEAMRLSEETLKLATELDDPWVLAMVSLGRGLATASGGDIPRAREEIERATEAAKRSGNPFVIAFAALSRGRMAAFVRDADWARAAFAEAAEIYRRLGDRRFENVARSDLGHALRRSGELEEAEEVYRETIGEWQRMGNRAAIANQLESFAFIALARHDDLRAAQLLGSAETIRQAIAAPMLPLEEMEYAEAVATLKAEIDGEVLTAAWQKGGAISLAEAIDFASGK